MFAIILMSIWKNMGLNMVIYLAGLQGIPPHLYEAAEIDGAGRLSMMLKITVPLLAPTTYFVVIVYFIGALQVFVQIFIMTCGNVDATAGCGGPLDATVTIVWLLYWEAFNNLKMGFAAALSVRIVHGDRRDHHHQHQAAFVRDRLLIRQFTDAGTSPWRQLRIGRLSGSLLGIFEFLGNSRQVGSTEVKLAIIGSVNPFGWLHAACADHGRCAA